ncbi:MAG: hypothetical protein ACO1RX_06710 [Candidatus Sericytochromatia bacterium]
MNAKSLFAFSLSLTLVACQNVATLTPPTPVAQSALSSKQTKAQAPSGLYSAQVSQDGQHEQLSLQVRLPQGFRTQLVDASRLAFVQVSLTGEGIDGTITHDGAAYLPVSGDSIEATLSDIPLNSGDLRLVRVRGYDAQQNPLPGFDASAWYRSQTGVTTINLVLNRVQNLLVDVLEVLLAERPAVLDTLDIAALQSNIEQALGYAAATGEFARDPLLLDADAIATLIQTGQDLPDVGTLENQQANVQDVEVDLELPQAGALSENVRFVLNDPLSKPYYLPLGTSDDDSVEFENVPNGTWTLSAYNDAGTLLNSTTVTVSDGNVSIAQNPFPVSGAATLNDVRINDLTEDDQDYPRMAMDAQGNFVVVWESDVDGYDNVDVYARRYNSSGVALGSEFRVNTTTDGYQEDPDVAMDANGNFVVVWEEDYSDLHAQRYNSQGMPVGSEFQVMRENGNEEQDNPAVAMDSEGDFVVAWTGYEYESNDDQVFAQRYDSQGNTVGSVMAVNNNLENDKYDVDVALDADGDFVLVWESEENDEEDYGIYARRFSNTGADIDGTEFRVNTLTNGSHYNPNVGMDASGNFTIVWQNEDQNAISGRQYNTGGNAVGNEFRVNTFGNSEAQHPRIAMNGAGQFVVVWDIEGQDGAETGVYAQRFNSAAVPQGAEFRVNSVPYFSEEHPSVAIDSGGRFGVVWYGDGDYAGDDDDIFGQLYAADGTVRGIPDTAPPPP